MQHCNRRALLLPRRWSGTRGKRKPKISTGRSNKEEGKSRLEGSGYWGRKPALRRLGCLRQDSGKDLLKGCREDWVMAVL